MRGGPLRRRGRGTHVCSGELSVRVSRPDPILHPSRHGASHRRRGTRRGPTSTQPRLEPHRRGAAQRAKIYPLEPVRLDRPAATSRIRRHRLVSGDGGAPRDANRCGRAIGNILYCEFRRRVLVLGKSARLSAFRSRPRCRVTLPCGRGGFAHNLHSAQVRGSLSGNDTVLRHRGRRRAWGRPRVSGPLERRCPSRGARARAHRNAHLSERASACQSPCCGADRTIPNRRSARARERRRRRDALHLRRRWS